jgi:archaemetzincin
MAAWPGITLVPFGKKDPDTFTWLKEDLLRVLASPVKESSPLPLSSRHFRKERNQYLADGLLSDLTAIVPSEHELTLGITDVDIFSPGLNFVFGIATTGRALISTFQLRPECYGMPHNAKLFRWRILTEAVHELGHAFGLPHCEYAGCVMYFSNWIGDTDRKGPDFCYRCRRRIEQVRKGDEG